MKPADWKTTREALHLSMQVLRSARAAAGEPMPNHLHYSSFLHPNGASTGPLGGDRELRLDFERLAVTFHQAGEEVFAIGLEGHHQISLFDAVFEALAEAGLDLDPDRKKVGSEAPFRVDQMEGRAFAAMMWRAFEGIARFKARRFGFQSPIALWPHGFDLSTLYFSEGHDESSDPHVNIGFSPYTEEVGEPYLYIYAWPTPEGLAEKLPDVWDWQGDWGAPGASLRFSRWKDAGDLPGTVESYLAEAFPIFLAGLENRKA